MKKNSRFSCDLYSTFAQSSPFRFTVSLFKGDRVPHSNTAFFNRIGFPGHTGKDISARLSIRSPGAYLSIHLCLLLRGPCKVWSAPALASRVLWDSPFPRVTPPPSNLDAGTKSAGVHHVYGPPEVPRPDVSIKPATSGSFYVL